MRITRIDIEGKKEGDFAIVTNRRGSDFIEVEFLTPKYPDGKIHHVNPACNEDIGSMAECMQFELEGSNDPDKVKNVVAYYRALKSMSC